MPEAALPEAVEIAPDSAATRPFNVAQFLLHHAHNSLRAGQVQASADSLARATDLLIALLSPQHRTGDEPIDLTAEERAGLPGLTSATIELYSDVLPKSTSVPVNHPVARLIDAVPTDVRALYEEDPNYRDLYIRKLAGSSEVPIDINGRVKEKIRFFQTDGAKIIRRWLHRSGAFRDLIVTTLRDEGLPEDLIYLSMIESGFNTKAYSRARAVGLWQFMRHTGRLYGLKRTTWVDERRDPIKSTRAAARHLSHLYNLFGDWRLVITAYNCGQGRLDRAIRQAGTENFWQIDVLPRETQNHLPKYMAALLISRDPSFFGIHNLTYAEPLAYDVVKVSEPVDLRNGAECAGTTYERMRELNPELRLGYSPPLTTRKFYPLRVPIGTSDRFIRRWASLPEARKVQLVEYKVRAGQTVSHIARELSVKTQAILDANGIVNPRRVRVGQKLKIPVHPRSVNRATFAAQSVTPPGSGNAFEYRVKRGDTLWGIAKRMGVTAQQIRRWNTIRSSGMIHPGDRLTIHRSGGAVADAGTTHYRVRRGDTLWEIARIFGTSVNELKRLNGIDEASNLRAGTRLRVQGSGSSVE